MSRILELVLFVTPFAGFVIWRLVFPSPLPPPWLVYSLVGLLVLMSAGLLWLWHIDASDASLAYVPAELRNGRIVPAHPAAPQ